MMEPNDLRTLSGLLDEAFALSPAQRDAWLDSLEGDSLRLAPTLRRLLARAGARETADLLDRLPQFTLAENAGETAADFEAGAVIGPYRLSRPIGRGGMGEVWLAERHDGMLERRVALKLPLSSARRNVLVERFARERDILASLAHPHIARLYDAGITDEGQPYLALEYVEGQPITAYCREQGLDVRQRVQLLKQVLDAVQHAHANLVVHRDLKPSNVLVNAAGRAMLLDFGIAKLLQEDQPQAEETELTRAGGRALTLHHAAPEQITGAPISTATDVWALGVLLYELIAGQVPFRHESRGQLEQAILDDEPRPPSGRSVVRGARLSRGQAADLDTIVLKALKKEPAERYASATALAEDLERWLADEPVRAQRDSAWYRARKFVARHRVATSSATLASLAVLAASAASLWQAGLAREQAAIARTEARTAQAVQEFIEDVFRTNSIEQADPLRARQRSAEELLDEGAARVEQRLRDEPAAEVRVLETLADMYSDMIKPAKAATLNERRAALLSRLHGPTHPQHVTALAEWTSSLSQAGQDERAESVAAQAEGLLGRTPQPDPEVRARLDLALVGMQLMRGGGYDLERSERAVRLLRARQPRCRCLLVALDAYAGALRTRGHAAQSLAVVREALERAPQVPDGGASMFSALLASQARAQGALGDQAAALASFERAIALSDRHNGADSATSVLRRHQMARHQLAIGNPAHAAALLVRAREAVERWPAEAPQRRYQEPETIALEASVALRRGRPETALDLLAGEPTQGIHPADPAERPHLAALRHLHRGEALAALGRDGDAETQLRAAAALIGRHRLAADALLRVEQARTLLLLRQGQLDAAAALLTAIEARPSDVLGSLWSTATRGSLLLARGDCNAAASLADSALALPHAADAPEPRARLRLLLGRALACSGRPAEAVPVLRAAVADWDVIEEPAFGFNAAAARSALAAILQATGAEGEAAIWSRQAAAILARHPRAQPPAMAASGLLFRTSGQQR